LFTARKLGGSNLITAGFWASAKEFLQAQEAVAKQKKGEKGKKGKMSKEEKAAAKLKEKQAKKAEKERLLAEKRRGFQLDPSNVMPALKVAEREYKQVTVTHELTPLYGKLSTLNFRLWWNISSPN